MKSIFRNMSIAHFCIAIAIFLVSLPSSAQLMLAHEGHHDAGGCVIKTGDFPVTVSIYEVPEGDIPPMHSFCSSIPNAGKINMTIELPDFDKREIPIAVRVLMGGHDDSDGNASDSAHGAHEVLYLPPEKYSSGIIVVATNLEHLGQYTVQLETEDSTGSVKTAVKIPVDVGGGGEHGDHGPGFGTLEIILLIAVAGAGAFIYTRKQKDVPKDQSKES